MDTTTTTSPCTHDGNLKGLCATCLRQSMDAIFGWNAIDLDDAGCAVMRDVIDEFCARHEDSFHGLEGLDADLAERIAAQFTDKASAADVARLIEIHLFG